MKIEGKEKLARKLRAMPKVARAEIHEALRKSADEMVETAKGFAPKKTGALAESIHRTFGNAGAGRLGDKDLTVTIQAGDDNAFYAAFDEFGTVKAPAHPFFFPAYRLLKKRMKGRLTRATNKAAKKVAAGS